MGKNYSTTSYKKQYDTEYVKSYPSFRKLKKVTTERKSEYETTSKKIDSRYSERGKGRTSEPAYHPAGAQSTSERAKSNIPIETPPPYNKQKRSTTDYSYIDPKALRHPIISLGRDMYKNIYTDEVIAEHEARKILEYAGYRPKYKKLNIFGYLMVCVLAFFIKLGGPILFIIYGSYTKRKCTTVYEKHISGYILNFQMPATESQKAVFRKRGNVYLYTGILVGIVQIIYYSKLVAS